MFGFWKKIFGRDSKSPMRQHREAYVSPFKKKRKQAEMVQEHREAYVSTLKEKRKQAEIEKAGEVILDKYRPDEHIPESIEEAVVVKAKPKRARTKKGTYKADDKSTPDVNEAWVGGKAPKKKASKKKAPVKVTRKKSKKK